MKKRFKIICIFFSFLFIHCSNGKENKVVYSRSITGILSPYYDYKPALIISKEETSKVNYYKFEYDDKNRVSKISRFSRNKLNSNSYFYAAIVKYDYKPKQLVRTYYDHNEKPVSMWRHYYGEAEIHKEVFELDEKNKKKSLVFYNIKGDRVETGHGTYEYKWKLTKAFGKQAVEQKSIKKSSELNTLTPYFDFYVTLMTSDKNGNLDLVYNFGKEGKKLENSERKKAAYVDFYFDEDGTETAYEFFDSSGNKVKRQDTDAGHFGYAKIQYTNLKKSKNKFFDGYAITYLDEKGTLINNSQGYAKEIHGFDKYGSFNAVTYYNYKKEKIIMKDKGFGYHKVKLFYNDNGDRTELKYYDTKGKLMNNANGIARIYFEYDENRNQVKRIEYDKNGTIIKKGI